ISLLDNATTASTSDVMQSTTCYKDFCTGLRVLFDCEQKSFEKLGYIGYIDLSSDLATEDSQSIHLPFE
ncbi:exodeoxyribonuclease V, partial [Bifidobacteriaceae bacterium WP012]